MGLQVLVLVQVLKIHYLYGSLSGMLSPSPILFVFKLISSKFDFLVFFGVHVYGTNIDLCHHHHDQDIGQYNNYKKLSCAIPVSSHAFPYA